MTPLPALLKRFFGDDFPVSGGNAGRDDPLVITSTKDYVSIEYIVAKHLLENWGLEYKLEKQQVVQSLEGRVTDVLTYATKPVGATDWTETRRFYFDVTVGFRCLGKENAESGYREYPIENGPQESPVAIRNELLEFSHREYAAGRTPSSHLVAVKSDGKKFVFPLGKLDLRGNDRLDFIRGVLAAEGCKAYGVCFRVGVQAGPNEAPLERIAVFAAGSGRFAEGELTLDSREEDGPGKFVCLNESSSPGLVYLTLLDPAPGSKRQNFLDRLMNRKAAPSKWDSLWNSHRDWIAWL